MTKLLIIPALMLGSAAIAQDYQYEITPLIGYNIAEGNLDLENQTLIGAEVQYNSDSVLKPELSVLYTDADYENSNISTDIYRIAINGVHEYDSIGFMSPLTKIGVGYETIDTRLSDNRDSLFFDAGVGAKIPLNDAIALKLEAVYMLKNNSNRWDSNLAVLAGINFAFGPKAQEVTPQPEPMAEPVPVIDGDDDKDGVLNSIDKCPTTPAGKPVNSDGCFIDGDDDKDGVLNSVDKCPTTPAGKPVNSDGCFIDGDDDKDGVLNSVDKCPTTPAGKPVNSDGCFVDGDDDKDGVLNSIDECPTTPAGNVVTEDGCTKEINLHILFKNNSFEVDEESKKRVEKFANFLKDRPNYTTQIIGHTNNIGRESNNKKLSENRANSVRDLIIEFGIDSNRVTAIGRGESDPVASNNTPEGLEQNRRIEATLNRN
ncbi:OmpA family protein [Candidatus Sulfurimonas marisnigri]|uniref:OmpA family protein n=1 Tax=Candidatus Sulfurimonas marisnigri TaxID=2740405 RepID=A0A7S7M001_9BACT|nr:OmpA family protein [Candidatus Sulfurimonas marisnigri]QOY54591.1 OmpA family protein [Candidatus Sulfurimonas marisnigri]